MFLKVVKPKKPLLMIPHIGYESQCWHADKQVLCNYGENCSAQTKKSLSRLLITTNMRIILLLWDYRAKQCSVKNIIHIKRAVEQWLWNLLFISCCVCLLVKPSLSLRPPSHPRCYECNTVVLFFCLFPTKTPAFHLFANSLFSNSVVIVCAGACCPSNTGISFIVQICSACASRKMDELEKKQKIGKELQQLIT